MKKPKMRLEPGAQDANRFSGSVVHESHREPCQRRLVVPATNVGGERAGNVRVPRNLPTSVGRDSGYLILPINWWDAFIVFVFALFVVLLVRFSAPFSSVFVRPSLFCPLAWFFVLVLLFCSFNLKASLIEWSFQIKDSLI
jgi:hypothetical protein